MRDLPPWGKRVVSVVKVLGVVGAALFAFLAGAMDLYGKYDELKRKTVNSYETLAPAVQELQELLTKHIEETEGWAAEVDLSIDRMNGEGEPLEARIRRLEYAILLLGNRHRGVDIEELDQLGDAEEPAARAPASAMPDAETMVTAEPTPPPPKAKKPARYVPDRIEQADVFQQQRQKSKCETNDPMCGLR